MTAQLNQFFNNVFPSVFDVDYKTRIKALANIEKISRKYPRFLEEKKGIILGVLAKTELPEMQECVAQLLPRLSLKKIDMQIVKNILDIYLKSKSVNVQRNTLQAISDLARQGKISKRGAVWTIYFFMSHCSNPALIARGKKLLKVLEK